MSTPVRFTVASVGGSWEDSSSASMSRTWSVLHQQAGSSKPGIPDVVICEFEVLKDADQRKQRIRSRIISCSISSPSPAGVHICGCTSEKRLWFLNKESLNSEWRAVAASPPGLLPHGSLQNLGSFHFSFTWFFPLKTAATSPFYLLNTQARPPAPRSCRQTEAWHWRLAAWVMAISSGDALESRSDEEPSQSLPWNIIALMRPVQQQWLWPRFSLFFLKILMLFPSEVPDVMHVFLLAALFMTQYILLCNEAAYGSSRQQDVRPLSYFWVICLISSPAIENLRWMMLIWSFWGDKFK